MTALAGITCPRCAGEPGAVMHLYSQAGRLAAHLAEDHGVGASEALRDARRLMDAPPAVTPADRVVVAKRLGVKPSHPIVADMLHRAGVVVVEPDRKEAHVAKKKRAQQKCRKCQQPGHNAKSCTQAAASAAPRLNKLGKPHGPIAGASNGSAGDDLAAKARASAKEFAVSKLREELTWAKAYVAELERLVAGA